MAVDTWRHVSSQDLTDWRSKVKNDLRTKRGTRYEYNTARTKGLEPVGVNEDGSATVSSPSSSGIRSHRETTEIVAQEMVSWIQESRDSFMGRIRMLKQMGNFQHLTDEDAASVSGLTGQTFVQHQSVAAHVEERRQRYGPTNPRRRAVETILPAGP